MIVGALLNVIAHDEEVLIVFGILMIFARDIGIICLKMEKSKQAKVLFYLRLKPKDFGSISSPSMMVLNFNMT